ncbi:hypothetical protein [Pseudoalteromonas aurantia]|uniref:Uncharacterized protein n=1 Tax=Pseudoalteromonas aurantia TaxID=43654 RepID=A0A5S3V271_9GAMM|nr:hypothetical protein [Pseudoalteromonas aurantia]TMO64843.1 hypothetical protein CWC19_18175 [Pseudoalteromonas aurantia]
MQLITSNLYRPALRCTHPLMLSHENTPYLSILLSEDDYQTRYTVSVSGASLNNVQGLACSGISSLANSLANMGMIVAQPPVFLTLVALVKQEVTHG